MMDRAVPHNPMLALARSRRAPYETGTEDLGNNLKYVYLGLVGVYHICKLFTCGQCKLYHCLDNWSMAADGNYVNTKMTRDDL